MAETPLAKCRQREVKLSQLASAGGGFQCAIEHLILLGVMAVA